MYRLSSDSLTLIVYGVGDVVPADLRAAPRSRTSGHFRLAPLWAIAAAITCLGAAASAPAAILTRPIVTALPTVTGTAAQDQHLSANPGKWTSVDTPTFTFRWFRCDATGDHCAAIPGATSSTYTVVAKDIGGTLGLRVIASSAGGTGTAYAGLVGPIANSTPLLVSTAQPSVGGTPQQGATLTVSTGAWSPTPASVTYTWERCNANGRVCQPIPAANGNTYIPGAVDVGHAICVLVQATFGTTVETAFSTGTVAISGGTPRGPVNTLTPVITGLYAVGEKLAATPGTWTASGTPTFTFNWYRCDTAGSNCLSIHGATGPTYTLVGRDIGATIGFAAHATDPTGTVTAYSALVGPAAPAGAALAATAPPTVTGTARVGQTLSTSSGSWTAVPLSYAYAWLRCNANGRACTTITAATAATYPLTSADAGHTLVAVVTAVSGSAAQAVFSLPSPIVA